MSFEPFRSVVIPKSGAGLSPAAGTPVESKELPSIILEGPALDADAIRADAIPASRRTSVSAPGSAPESVACESAESAPLIPVRTATVVGSDDEPGTEAPEVVQDRAETPPEKSPATPQDAHPLASEDAPSLGGTHTTARQFVVAYDGKLVGTYRSVKRIQNRTAYLKVAEQLVGQIAEFDPSLIVLYKLTEVPQTEISIDDLEESFQAFPRHDVPAP